MVSPSYDHTHRQTKAPQHVSSWHQGSGTRLYCRFTPAGGQEQGTVHVSTAQRPACRNSCFHAQQPLFQTSKTSSVQNLFKIPGPSRKTPTFMPARCCVIFPPSGNSGWLPAQYTCSTGMGHKPWAHTSPHMLLPGDKCARIWLVCAGFKWTQNASKPESHLDQKVQHTQVSVTRDGCVGPHHTLSIDV